MSEIEQITFDQIIPTTHRFMETQSCCFVAATYDVKQWFRKYKKIAPNIVVISDLPYEIDNILMLVSDKYLKLYKVIG